MNRARLSVVIEADLPTVWGVVRDYESYPEFIPEMRSVRVVRKSAAAQDVEFGIELELLGLKKAIHYTLAMTETPPARIDWTLVRSDVLKGDDGGWEFRSLGERRTEATYHIEVKLGPFVPGAISRFLVEQSLPKLLSQFKRRAESRPAAGTESPN
jgi:ribosome-associated toxin RatA of RatAB toxin-antitoxin module